MKEERTNLVYTTTLFSHMHTNIDVLHLTPNVLIKLCCSPTELSTPSETVSEQMTQKRDKNKDKEEKSRGGEQLG